jgi:hypothetical protein
MELIWSLVHLLYTYLIREAASIHFTFPNAVLPELPIAMFITNPRQIPLAASLERCAGSSASIATRNRCDSFQSSTRPEDPSAGAGFTSVEASFAASQGLLSEPGG